MAIDRHHFRELCHTSCHRFVTASVNRIAFDDDVLSGDPTTRPIELSSSASLPQASYRTLRFLGINHAERGSAVFPCGNMTHRDLKPEKVIVTTSPCSVGGGIFSVRT
jgi:hypothetical protein